MGHKTSFHGICLWLGQLTLTWPEGPGFQRLNKYINHLKSQHFYDYKGDVVTLL
jgi:hypothetical protein